MAGACEGNARGVAQGMNPDLDEMPQLYEACEGWKSICGQAYNLKGIKEMLFFFFLKLCFSFTVPLFLA